jgi:hypothetical protein
MLKFSICYCDVSPESRDIGARIYEQLSTFPPDNEQQLGTLPENEGIGTVMEGVLYPVLREPT